MSLEIAILSSEGAPEHSLSVGVNTHHKIMEHVRIKPNSILIRMDDYYSDAEYNTGELIQLSNEIDWLMEKCSKDENLVKFLSSFKDLVGLAISLNKGIEVLAD